MVWPWRRNSNPKWEPEVASAEDVGAECEAFLAGRYLEVAVHRNEPVPGWVWLNRLAHTSDTELTELAQLLHDPGDGWRHAMTRLAGDILEYARKVGVDIRSLQRDVLVPLELQVMAAGTSRTLHPQQLIYLVRTALRGQPSCA